MTKNTKMYIFTYFNRLILLIGKYSTRDKQTTTTAVGYWQAM